jgi:hypothetical protein
MDVYKTHRSAAFPDYVLENTKKNALTARTDYKGLVVRGAGAGYPFPIPKDAHEMMWNHQLRFRGRSTELFVTGVVVDRAGQVSVGNEMEQWVEFPYYDQDRTRPDAEVYWKMKYYLHGPAARVGEAFLIIDDMNVIEKPRIVYLYLPGQRRVRLAPEVAFDTPQPVSNGNMTYDDDQMFNGSMERYDWKIVGKKEVIIPYNCYKLVYECKQDQMLGKQHLNPDLVRWELHRMWIVEATLKQGKRHIVPKRRLYLDEDTWFALATDQYDAHGNFFKAGFIFFTQSYDATVPNGEFNIYYNFISGRYNTTYWPGIKGGYYRYVKTRPLDFWTPGTLAATGLR